MTTGNCAGPALLGCLDQGSDTTFTSIAVSNATVGDLSIATGKELHFNFRFFIPGLGSLNSNVPWGYFLTSNSTAPATSNYQPQNDRSVIFNQRFTCISACNTNSPQIQFNTYLLRNQAQDTISSEDAGCTAGSVFLCASHTEALATSNLIVSNIALNFTGSISNANNCSGTTGSGCSDASLSYSTETDANTMVIPIQSLLNSQLYFGFYVSKGLNSDIRWGWAQFSNSVAFGIMYYVPSPTAAIQPPNIDTGGFFGPIIKALISIGVFIGKNLLNFANFLVGIFAPIMASIVAIFSGVITAVFNAIGSLWGDSSFGTQILSFFSNLTSYLANVFANAIAFIGSAITFLSNALSIITAFFAGGNTFIGLWTNMLSGIAALIGSLNGFFGTLLYWYNLGVFGFNIIIIMMTAILAIAAALDYMQYEDPIAAFVAVGILFFLLYILQVNSATFNVIAGNSQVLTSYQTAWTNTSFMVQLLPILFFSVLASWIGSIGEGGRIGFHGSGGHQFLPHFRQTIELYKMLTIDVFKGGYWFFKEAYDTITKAITALKGRWLPAEVLGTG